MQICPYMNGSTCAESYCDMWNTLEKRCSIAVKAEKNIELLSLMVDKLKKIEITQKTQKENKCAVSVLDDCKRVLH